MGRVWLVGAGPGDPDLITVRGRRLLECADVVVHDRLVGPGVLELIPVGTLRIDVGKGGYRPSVSQEEIDAILIRLARAGLSVVRLKGGDPFVFGRGAEEAEALHRAGVPVEVVPGVTAGVAGPALAGIPVTHRGTARSVALVTATVEAESAGGGPAWDALARLDTLVVYMAGRTARSVAGRLVEAGRPPTTPVALVLDASLPDQEVRVSDLGTMAAEGAGPTDGRPALLVIGEVVALRDRLLPELTAARPAEPGHGP
jgi:uroporphyrin-III C-methyltransferase